MESGARLSLLLRTLEVWCVVADSQPEAFKDWGLWKPSAVMSSDWRRQRAGKIKPPGAIRSRAKVPSTWPPLRDVKRDQMG